MLRREFAYGLLAAAAVGGKFPPQGSCSHNSVLPYDRPIEIKMRALDGPDFVLSKFTGAAVWINVFATWCPPCNSEQPFVVAAAQRYFDRGLRIIGMDYMEPDDTVRAYRKKYGITYPIAMDMRGGFTQALEVGTAEKDIVFPVQLFFTPLGYLRCYVVGAMQESQVIVRIEELLAAGDATPSPSPAAVPANAPTPTPKPTPSSTPSASAGYPETF